MSDKQEYELEPHSSQSKSPDNGRREALGRLTKAVIAGPVLITLSSTPALASTGSTGSNVNPKERGNSGKIKKKKKHSKEN
jgi:hypothetical protein